MFAKNSNTDKIIIFSDCDDNILNYDKPKLREICYKNKLYQTTTDANNF